MTENSPTPRYRHGEPCWADVQTRDVNAAKAFYAAVFGWTFKDLPTPDGRSYAKAFVGEDLVATVAPQNPHQEAQGTHAQWNIYFAAEDAAGLAEDVPHAGGSVQFGPEEVGDTGVMVFVDPPGGGTTGVWQSGTHTGTGRYNQTGCALLDGTADARAAGRRRVLPAAVRPRGDRVSPGRRRDLLNADG
ncbi:VOC family protein [Arthrobacter sp. UYCo732]|uniref:VOC family protein n=1 Tax=Arthrobacter sp. UYCo732 TaxID=3156336 RepID=UPI003391E007